jgi:septum formation protein
MIHWQRIGRPVILASQSPRRKEILAQMGMVFETVAPVSIDESSFIDPGDLVSSLKSLAEKKARSVADVRSGALVLGADTVVVEGKNVLGKPVDRNDARDMLMRLSNKKHRVLTGIALVCTDRSFSTAAAACTDVFFRNITLDEVDAYLDLDEYRDKAGAYAIQGRAMAFVDRINGCFYNVVGLPVAETIAAFKHFAENQG